MKNGFFPKIPKRKSCDTSQKFPRGHMEYLAWSECLWQKNNPTSAWGPVCFTNDLMKVAQDLELKDFSYNNSSQQQQPVINTACYDYFSNLDLSKGKKPKPKLQQQ